ncbi:MAG: PQQ-binding-like beta-propeller repeat protein, partial [bacterium]
MHRQIMAVFLVLVGLPGVSQSQENWPQWRGPDQNGVSTAKDLPETWSETDNIVWKTPMPSWSGGTPVIWGDQIFLPSPSAADPEKARIAQEEARRRQERRSQQNPNRRRRRRRAARGPGGSTLLLIAISKKDGSVLWTRELDEGNELHRKGNNTSPSPVTDGKHVWAVTGTGAVKGFDMSGTEIWQRRLQDDYGQFGLNWGYASSPLLYDGKLILQVLHGYRTDDPSYLVALDALTGKEIWRQERPTDAIAESPDAYTTPTLLQYDGQTQIVVTGADYVTGYDPGTGKEIWRAAGLNPKRRRNYRIVASPIVVNGMIYAPSRRKPLLAIRAGGVGDVSSNLVWKWEGAATTDVPTPVCDGKYL